MHPLGLPVGKIRAPHGSPTWQTNPVLRGGFFQAAGTSRGLPQKGGDPFKFPPQRESRLQGTAQADHGQEDRLREQADGAGPEPAAIRRRLSRWNEAALQKLLSLGGPALRLLQTPVLRDIGFQSQDLVDVAFGEHAEVAVILHPAAQGLQGTLSPRELFMHHLAVFFDSTHCPLSYDARLFFGDLARPVAGAIRTMRRRFSALAMRLRMDRE